MRQLSFVFASILFFITIIPAEAQDVTQKLRVNITGPLGNVPVENAQVILSREGVNVVETVTDVTGNFEFEKVPVGRYRIDVNHASYFPYTSEVFLLAAKELFLTIELRERIRELDEVQVTATSRSVYTTPGISELSIEKATRIAANYFDPVRVTTAFPGVVIANDQNNAIIVRGNSPEGLLWRLNDLDILNPNHLSNAGALGDRPAANGGGVNVLSTQMLGTTRFITGNYAPTLGNLQSAVVDMELRESRQSGIAHTLQASVIGLDYGSEGTIVPDRLSYTFNARYSTVGLLSAAGVDFGGESISFHDVAAQLVYRTKKQGVLKGFFVTALSKNDFKTKPQDEWETDKDRFNIYYEGSVMITGLTFDTPLKNNARFKTGMAWSRTDPGRYADFMGNPNAPLRWDELMQNNHLGSQFVSYQKRLGKAALLELGNYFTFWYTDLYLYEYPTPLSCLFCAVPNEGISDTFSTWQTATYAKLTQPVGERFTTTLGVRGVKTGMYSKYSIEPRLSVEYLINDQQNLSLSYTSYSRLQSPSIYLSTGNENLLPTKSQQLTMGYQWSITEDLMLRLSVYHQYLSDVPVQPDFTFSVINLMEPVERGGLVNEGAGINTGIDAVIEKSFFQQFYLLAGGSYYQSQYRDGSGQWRNTRFDGNYTFNLSAGKEWNKRKDNANKTFAADTRFIYLGGLNEMPILPLLSGFNGRTVFDEAQGFVNAIPDYTRLDLRLSWRKHKPGYTRSIILDMQNVLNLKNVAYRYFDAYQLQRATQYSLGIIPVLAYRVEF
ncbi:MAG: carboxypeptidase regulatory-like domain-containing protein [Cyclobacteriaceae bacterium]|nr:carboxypeptidase regulatory-like domain-containing protein [Cyclobacteriaceae bacterium]